MEKDYINKNTQKNIIKSRKDKSKVRMLLVILFILLFSIVSYVSLRGSYLEFKELGQNYVEIFFTNLKYRYMLIGTNFILLYFIIYFTNKGIKKGLKAFFEKENKEMPKLLNKSLALVISAIISVIFGLVAVQKILLCVSNASFGIQDQIFNLDVSYYMFQKPVIEMFISYFILLILGLSIYSALYYIVVFNIYFDGIDGQMLKQSIFMKKLSRNVKLIAIGIAAFTILNTQNIIFGDMLKVDDDIQIIGASYTDATIKLWGYIIFACIIVVSVWKAVNNFIKGDTKKVVKNLILIPSYLVCLFIIMIVFDLIFVNSNKLDKEKRYLSYNIESTKNAYNINIEEINIENSGTITEKEVNDNQDIIDNVVIVSKDAVLKTLEDNQTGTGYYSYRDANIGKYSINGKEKLVYISPREVVSKGRTYSNKTYEYTHGIGQIITSATSVTETGNIEYIQKDLSGKDNKIKTTQPRMYFGLDTNGMVATNAKNKQEYDYTDENGNEVTTNYTGNAGLNLNFVDKLILGITKGDINLAFSGNVTQESKVLINRNVIERAKKALPYLIYDENPYTVINEEGKIIWVIDGYTVSSSYPYSQYTNIQHDDIKQKINYIRNSVKVLIDSYDGTVSYYITDRTDPIAMAYRNIYPTLFNDIDQKIPEDISKHFIYPEYLYNIQAEMLKIYHNVKPDILYRADDLWNIAKYNNTKSSKSTGTVLSPYYTMVKTNDSNSDLGLVQIYTPNEKQNIISYLVGKTEENNNKLKLYKFSQDSNIVGPMQLDKQLEEDEAISSELESINTTGTKITKQMIIVPINNTLLYVEPVYQTMLNESNVQLLKKVIVASGNKVAIGDNFRVAIQNLLSKYAVDIEVENTDDIKGLIEAIIKANNNLTQSNTNNDWEMMGKDIQKLQTLIDSLEKLKNEEEKKKEEKYADKSQQNVQQDNDLNNNNLTNKTQ